MSALLEADLKLPPVDEEWAEHDKQADEKMSEAVPTEVSAQTPSAVSQSAPLPLAHLGAGDGSWTRHAVVADDAWAASLYAAVIAELCSIYDPEIPVNIYDLGLIYEVTVEATGVVDIQMTLTTPACPVAQSFPSEVQRRIGAIEGVTAVSVNLVWDPPWTDACMTEAAKLTLGLL